jgi:LPS sulfotransferase NodH
MALDFDHFIILAGMRTGSNFLESCLNAVPGLSSHGELFNPHFVGAPKTTEMFGLTIKDREADPQEMLRRMKVAGQGLNGFRFFHDHDPRVLSACLDDRRCAKIILTRNLVDSYVSHQIARQTDQWRLSDLKHAKTSKVRFDTEAFESHVQAQRDFQARIRRALQTSGQAFFLIDYDEIADVAVINGLARFLGVETQRKQPSRKTKKQNPAGLRDKLTNFEEAARYLEGLDVGDLDQIPNFEPPRGPSIPNYVAAPKVPILFMPIKGGPNAHVENWLSALSGAPRSEFLRGFTQKSLRQWKRQNRDHISFAVVRHPVARLYEAFTQHIVLPGPGQFVAIRETLVESYGLVLPELHEQDTKVWQAAFLGFAEFVKGNLNGQTGVRIDGAWASQSEILRGMGQFLPPDHVLRESGMENGLQYLAGQIGKPAPALDAVADGSPVPLHAIYGPEVEKSVRSAYQRDYMMFGFGPWSR